MLFVMVLITFSLAQEDSKKMEKIYSGASASTASALMAEYLELTNQEKISITLPR